MAKLVALNFASWRKSLLEDYAKRYNVPLPNRDKYTRRDFTSDANMTSFLHQNRSKLVCHPFIKPCDLC